MRTWETSRDNLSHRPKPGVNRITVRGRMLLFMVSRMSLLGFHQQTSAANVRCQLLPCRRRPALLPAKILTRSQPDEQFFAKFKHWLRKAAQRTTEAVYDAIAPILDTVSPAECANYFANAGYDQI